jgi:hypothetical protein
MDLLLCASTNTTGGRGGAAGAHGSAGKGGRGVRNPSYEACAFYVSMSHSERWDDGERLRISILYMDLKALRFIAQLTCT